jgi:hypothetical protein
MGADRADRQGERRTPSPPVERLGIALGVITFLVAIAIVVASLVD